MFESASLLSLDALCGHLPGSLSLDDMPSDQKTNKFDRQLRIWGQHGQEALEGSKVLMLNCSATGSEVMKNLVLGNIGSFTIVDQSRVTQRDLGNNFFVDGNSLGKSRAAVVTALLREMNDAVDGRFVEEDPETILSNREFFRDFTLVIGTQLPEQQALRLEETCQALRLPLLLVRSYGLLGVVRPSYGELCILESKPENVVDDLRLHRPWPALEAHALQYDLASLDDVMHKHVPYAALLIQAAHRYKAQLGRLPQTYDEKKQFKALLAEMERRPGPGLPSDEENFKEATQHAHRVWAPAALSGDVRAILADEKASQVTPSTPDFWVLVAALNRFMAAEGQGELPLDGAIPDMTATTESYIALQAIYREKAQEDTAALERHVASLLASIGRDPAAVPRESIRSFAKHCRHMKVVRTRSLAEECQVRDPVGSPSPSPLRALLTDEELALNATAYLLLRAADRFLAQHGRWPGADGAAMEDDVARLREAARSILGECSAASASSASFQEDLVAEVCRFGGGELHTVASIVGGMGSQEAIKLITGQFVPLDHTLVFNGVTGTTSVIDP